VFGERRSSGLQTRREKNYEKRKKRWGKKDDIDMEKKRRSVVCLGKEGCAQVCWVVLVRGGKDSERKNQPPAPKKTAEGQSGEKHGGA